MGCKARDRTSGFEGLVVAKSYTMDGTIRYGLQPKVTEKEPATHPDAMNIDGDLLEYVEGGISHLARPVTDLVTIQPGEEVQDRITKIKGTVLEKTEFLNGCVFLYMQGAANKDGSIPKAIGGSHYRFKKTGVGITKFIPKRAAAKAGVPAKPPGGPSSRMERA